MAPADGSECRSLRLTMNPGWQVRIVVQQQRLHQQNHRVPDQSIFGAIQVAGVEEAARVRDPVWKSRGGEVGEHPRKRTLPLHGLVPKQVKDGVGDMCSHHLWSGLKEFIGSGISRV